MRLSSPFVIQTLFPNIGYWSVISRQDVSLLFKQVSNDVLYLQESFFLDTKKLGVSILNIKPIHLKPFPWLKTVVSCYCCSTLPLNTYCKYFFTCISKKICLWCDEIWSCSFSRTNWPILCNLASKVKVGSKYVLLSLHFVLPLTGHVAKNVKHRVSPL